MEQQNSNVQPELAAPVQTPEPAVASGAVSDQGAASSRPRLSDEEVDQLVAFSNQAYEKLQQYQPYADKLDRIAKDEEYRTFVDSATEHYDNGRRQLETQKQSEIPEWAKPMVEFVETQKQQSSRSHQDELNRFYAEQREVANRIKRDAKFNDQQIADLASYADTLAGRYGRRVGIDEAYNAVKGFSAPSAGNPPTVGLRGDASTPGIPSASKIDVDAFKKDFHSSTLALLRGAPTS